ncbi:MAG: NADH-quinone oxidoreductase subunit NuoE [Gammaproteobacteria bacterium HGW-Gammaproteobacteria-1]|jgi:NADH-quinone oxidoreductase subunit E|nr:MAG: NADH-quinone oxidoreductase subunit NuoE [Gammaproteobacteria bacterium HGW-Gammaproteobacteria-1]
MAQANIELLTPASRAEIDTWVAKYPAERKQSAVMAALRIAQDQNGGWLTTELMDAVAAYLGIAPIAVYEVATFYSMYQLEPVGRHRINVCTNISCLLRGSEEVVDHLQKRLGVKLGETTADGRFTLKEVECLGACVNAPVAQIARQYYEQLTPELIDRIIDGLE